MSNTPLLTEEDVKWVIYGDNDLGVMIGNQIFTLFKGRSLERRGGESDIINGWRPLGKRELGECIRTEEDQDAHDWTGHSAPVAGTPTSEPSSEAVHRRKIDAALDDLIDAIMEARQDDVYMTLTVSPVHLAVKKGVQRS